MISNSLFIEYDFKGPLDIDLTINSGQTSQPPWQRIGNFFQELVHVEGKPCLITIHQDRLEEKLDIHAEYYSEISEKSILHKVKEIFSLDDDLNNLYGLLLREPELAPAIEYCNGLRLFKAHNPFECVISSISSANCSIKRWTRSINDIKHKWGEKYEFGSNNFYSFPTPQILSRVPEHELEEMQRFEDKLPSNFVFENNLQACGVGYRAKYIKKAAEILHSKIKMHEIADMKYEKAFDTLLQIPGVGPKVADCILLYGFGRGEAFPVDVWIKRIIEFFYFPGQDLKPSEVREFGRDSFGDYAGYVQLYLFHFARKSRILDLLNRKKIN